MPDMHALDDLDRRLLTTLQADSSLTNAELAEYNKLTTETVKIEKDLNAERTRRSELEKALKEESKGDPESAKAVQAEIARLGGTPMASFWVDFKPGYMMGTDPAAPPVSPSDVKGTHGYFPTHPELHATLIVSGPSIAKRGSLGEVDMRDIAPTLAKVMKVSLPDADGKPLF